MYYSGVSLLLQYEQAYDWKNFLRLLAKLKKAYFSGIAQIKLPFIRSDTVFPLFGVKDPYRPV